MDDKDIMQLAAEVDTVILDWCIKEKTTPLLLAGIVLARLTWLNDMVDTGDDYRKLCGFISHQTKSKIDTSLMQDPTDFTEANQWLKKFMNTDT